jgi:hypothetical protein
MRDWKFIVGIVGLLLGVGLQVSGIISLPLAIALWVIAAILLLLHFAKPIWGWLKPQGLVRSEKSLDFRVGETAYVANSPYIEESEVKDIICQVILGNPNDQAKSVTTFRLEIKAKDPYLVSEARVTREGRSSYLVPPGGGFSSVPHKQWLSLPVQVEGQNGVVGWIGFTLISRNDLTLAEAWKMDGELVAVQADGNELRVKFPACTLPHEQPQ